MKIPKLTKKDVATLIQDLFDNYTYDMYLEHMKDYEDEEPISEEQFYKEKEALCNFSYPNINLDIDTDEIVQTIYNTITVYVPKDRYTGKYIGGKEDEESIRS